MYQESSSIVEVYGFITLNGLIILYGKNKGYHKFK
ncbi:MAG: hypothetical protein H6Q53_83 [Deltaproteobacteria bacterium]|nr:hypothetical protein [Deltaproteobacteria bacterium]